jgi:hypothetical protein
LFENKNWIFFVIILNNNKIESNESRIKRRKY